VKTRSASTWLGCGCASAITVFMLGVLAVTWLSYRAGESLERQAAAPEVAGERVRELLPYDELPPGYVPVGATSVPLLVDMAFLRGEEVIGERTAREGETDAAEDAARAGETRETAGGTGDDGGARAAADDVRRGFLYLRFRDLFGRGERTRALLAGEEGEDDPLAQEEIRFEPEETVARGAFRSGGAAVTWTARRGRIQVDRDRFGVDVEVEGDDGRVGVEGETADPAVLALADLDCGDRYQRIAVWFAPDPAPDAPAGEVDWTGTPADDAALRTFLGHFRPCE